MTDGQNPANTRTITDYITSGGYSFSMTTTGVGDIMITAAPSPPGTTQGFTFISHTPAATLGGGNFFGVNFDDFVAYSLALPAFPGNIFHFTPSPIFYPAVPFGVGPGTLSSLSGTTLDGVVLYVVSGTIVSSVVDRVTL